ncbi:MAG: hypothetical protein JNM50_02670 [Chromatiales bacterium]|jgi:hypothetical protein|nr:hypothetical protein [Chromatiales bacterium]
MLDRLHKKPWIGLLGIGLGFLTQPLGHTVYTLIDKGFGDLYYLGAAGMAVVGTLLVWQGLKRAELPATLFGMLGGWFMWIGFFEFTFKFYAGLYSVPGYAVEPGVPNGYVAAPSANMLQATMPLMFALFILYGMFNLQTKCNFMRWFHRNLGFSPGMPTPDNHRSFARITAMEVLFVTWFCYLFWLYMIYFGTQQTGMNIIMSVYLAWTAWSLYLVWRAAKQIRAAAALRYGIGAGIVLWGAAEMPSHFGAYPEYWLHPFDYPVFNLIVGAIFVAGLVVIARPPVPAHKRGAGGGTLASGKAAA